MGTTRIKVIDLSSEQKEVKTSRKHAEKLAGAAKIKEENEKIEKAITESTEKEQEVTEAKRTQTAVPSKPSVPSVIKTKSKTPTKARFRSRRYQEAAKLVDKNQNYSLAEAIDLLYKTSTTKFDPTVEVHLAVSDKNVKANVFFPHSVAQKIKAVRYLVFADKPSDDKKVIMGDQATIEKIANGALKPKKDFDQVIATPKFMPQLAKIAKILGPVGMMPNPKNGTITEDPAKIVKGSQEQGIVLATEQTAPIIHTKIGKLSKKPQELSENFKTLIGAIGSTKIQKAVVKTTMSPAIKVDIGSAVAS